MSEHETAFINEKREELAQFKVTQESDHKKHRILLVDDNQSDAELSVDALKEVADTEVAFSSEIAIKKLRSEKFDLLLLDLNLGKNTGLDVIRIARAEKIKLPRMFMLTGSYALFGTLADAGEKLGVLLTISKPLNAEKIATLFYRL